MQREWEFPEPGRCVYPQGHPREPGFSFCGEPTSLSDEPSPYCHDHHRLTRIPIDRTEPRPMTWIVRREQDIGQQWEAAAE